MVTVPAVSSLALLLGGLGVAGAQPPPRAQFRLPPWKPTYSPFWRSTIIMPCNYSGVSVEGVAQAIKYGVAMLDWSNAKDQWANAKPMSAQELLTKQAEMVLAAEPGIPVSAQSPRPTHTPPPTPPPTFAPGAPPTSPTSAQHSLYQGPLLLCASPQGEQPRVWVYRNQIKALNFFSSVREKIDDPDYAGWFVHFKDYKGAASNHSYGKMAPACTFSKCSGLWHDQYQVIATDSFSPGCAVTRLALLQTPCSYHPSPLGAPGDGNCSAECDCGRSPCGE